MWTNLLAFVFVLAVLVLVSLLTLRKPAGSLGKYKRRPIMTDNECEFFARLVTALPAHYVFPQVSMTALLEASSGIKKTAHADRLRIAQQRIDYVVCDMKCEVIAVIELDDRTHSPGKDKIRDARLAQGGFRTIRFQSKAKPNAQAIRNAVLNIDPRTEPAVADTLAAGATGHELLSQPSTPPKAA